jgi:DNA-binding transcriptional ArsR family regulator
VPVRYLRMTHATMRDVQARSQLFPLLRSPLLGELLAWLYLHPDDSYSLIELARRFHVSHSTVSREADRLAESGLVIEERRGNLRLLQADSTNPLARSLTELLALTYGPAAVLADRLAAVAGVDEAYIFGSWAARYAGEAGPPPRDVDVLVIGEADDDDLAALARAAEVQLAREVTIHRLSAARWSGPTDDPFLASVRSKPLYPLVRSGDPS